MEFINKSMIKVYRIDGLTRKEGEIDFKSTTWKKSDGLWETPQGWIPLFTEDAERIREHTVAKLKKEMDEDPFGANSPQGPPLIRKKVNKEDDKTQTESSTSIENDAETNEKEHQSEIDDEIDSEDLDNQIPTQPPKPAAKRSQLLKKIRTDAVNTVKETPLAKIKNDSWKEVLKEQGKESVKQSEENIRSQQARNKELYLKDLALQHAQKEAKIKWAKRIAIGSIGAICLIGAVYYFSDQIIAKKTDSNSRAIFGEELEQAPSSTGASIWEYFYQKDEKEPSIAYNTKKHILKYAIEETIWLGKVKAALYDNQTGQVSWGSIAPYTDFDSNLLRAMAQVKKMYKEMRYSELEVSKDDFKKELEELKQLSQNRAAKEDEALKLLAKLGGEAGISLGTFPHKKLAQRANRENWISPLGTLYSDVSAKNHHNRFIVSPNDPRSVGEPVKWIEN